MSHADPTNQEGHGSGNATRLPNRLQPKRIESEAQPRPDEHTLDAEELDTVNDIVAASIETWGLPTRVERLALPSLLYSEADLEHMSFLLLDQPEGAGIAVAAWEAAATHDTPGNSRGLLLHGLYVVPTWQHQGIGAGLLELVGHWASARGYDGLLVRAWRESERFFRARGFRTLEADANRTVHPVRLWRELPWEEQA